MRKSTRNRRPTHQRRPDPSIAEVRTVCPDPAPADPAPADPAPVNPPAEADDATEDAVRRMVEAAYT
jgi:hypothetical protein